MKALALRVGLVVLFVWLGSCAAGIAVSRVAGPDGAAAVTIVRDIGIIILALLYLVTTLIAAAVCFAGAWVIGRFGGRLTAAVRWVNGKVYRVGTLAEGSVERVVVRPLAAAGRAATAAGTFVKRAAGAGVAGEETALR
jgi:Na+-transporting NADH:ubiquinone oxidoreductase subunit NqrB